MVMSDLKYFLKKEEFFLKQRVTFFSFGYK